MTPPLHLLTVWNPTYEVDALDAHVRVLLDWDERHDKNPALEDYVYVWWGKVRSPRRLQPLPHHRDVVAVGTRTMEDGPDYETHLYLTDYRSLYVAGLHSITETDPRKNDAEHVPAYYSNAGLNCDFWFQLYDIRLLVRDDLEGVASELARLRNVRYHNSPVSMYGGMLDLPLIVSRNDDQTYFSEQEYEQFAEGMLWARFDSGQRGSGALEATLREDHFGLSAWTSLETAARRFIVSAEDAFRARRHDPASDLSVVLVSYAKAVEVQANGLVRNALFGALDAARRVNVGGRTELMTRDSSLSLGQLARALGGEREFGTHLRKVLRDGAWLTGEFAVILDEFSLVRNAAAHGDPVDRETVTRWRNRMLGVGCESVLARLAAIQPKQP